MDKSNPTVNVFCSVAAGVSVLAASLGLHCWMTVPHLHFDEKKGKKCRISKSSTISSGLHEDEPAETQVRSLCTSDRGHGC